jgi:hypothetical protein
MEKGIHYKRMAKDSPGRGLSQLLLGWQPQKACDHMIAPQCLNSFFCGMCPYRFTVGVEEYNHFLGMPKPGLANRKLCGAVFYPDVSARQGTLLQTGKARPRQNIRITFLGRFCLFDYQH